MSRTIFRRFQATGFFGLIAAALLAGTASLAQAQSAWQVQSGNWSTASNWSNGLDYGGGGATFVIDNGGTATIDITSTGLVGGYQISVGSLTGTGTVNMSGGTLTNPGNYQELRRRVGHRILHPIRRSQWACRQQRPCGTRGRQRALHRPGLP